MSTPSVQSHVAGDPAGAAVATFAVATLLLGLTFVGAFPASSVGIFVPILVVIGIAEVLASRQAVSRGDNVIGIFFGTFGPFLITFGLFTFGLQHGWWQIAPGDLPHAEGGFLLAWTIILSVWFILSLALPLVFPVLIAVVTAGLWLLTIGTWTADTSLQKPTGALLLATAVVALYYMSSLWLGWLGLRILPAGPSPLQPLAKRHAAAVAGSPPAAPTAPAASA